MDIDVLVNTHSAIRHASGGRVLITRANTLLCPVFPDSYLVDETGRNKLSQHFELWKVKSVIRSRTLNTIICT